MYSGDEVYDTAELEEPPDPMTEAKRQEWLDDEDRHATWQGVEVEVS